MEGYQAVLFDLYGTLVDGRGEAVAGARELLASLPLRRVAIVTSATRSIAAMLLERALVPYPGVIVTADDVARGKPAPDCYLLAAARLGVAPPACVVVEDSEHGIDAAVDAGMDAIAIVRGRGTAFGRRATRLIERLADLHLRAAPDGIAID